MMRLILTHGPCGAWAGGVRRALVLLATLGLAACSSSEERDTLELEIGAAIRDQIRAARSEPAPPVVLTRALLDSLPDRYVEARLEDADLTAYLRPALRKDDTTPGRIEVWRSDDGASLTLRAGVLVATRGLRNDMLSASALVADGARQGPQRSGARRYEFAALDNRAQVITLVCDQQDLGGVRLEIVERSYPTRHLREICETGAGARVINDYWIDSRSGQMRQSRQWAGPTQGYLRLRRLSE